MEKKDISNAYFNLNMFWQNTFTKDEESKIAYIKGFETACKKRDNEYYGPIELEKKHLQNLFQALETWDLNIVKSRNNVAALIEGFSVTCSPNFDTKKSPDSDYRHLTKLFSDFIYFEYKIRDYSWPAQIDTYAYRNDCNWDEALDTLFHNFFDKWSKQKADFQTTIELQDDESLKFRPTTKKINLRNQSLSEISINDHRIRTGSVLKLGDLIGEDFKRTVHYDITVRDPSWDLYEASEKDFRHVRLCSTKSEDAKAKELEIYVLDRARRICSGISSKVRLITETDGNIIVYTDCFEIDIKRALAESEIMILQNHMSKEEQDTLKYYWVEPLENYSNGLIIHSELIRWIYDERINSRHPPAALPWVRWQLTFSGWHKVKRDGKRGRIR